MGSTEMLALAVLLGGCSFDMPGQPSAQEQCMRFIDAIDAKSVACKDTKPPDRAANVAHCGNVVAVNPLLSVDRCIDALWAAECAAEGRAGETWCSAFVEAQ